MPRKSTILLIVLVALVAAMAWPAAALGQVDGLESREASAVDSPQHSRSAHVRIVVDFNHGTISFIGRLDPNTAPMVQPKGTVASKIHKAFAIARAVSRSIRHVVKHLFAPDATEAQKTVYRHAQGTVTC